MRRFRRLLLCSSLTAAAVVQARPSFAQSAAESELAQALFDEAQALIAAGSIEEACPKLAESHRLEPAGGTVYNLAICLERQGKTASAYVAYDEALARAVKDGNREREAGARDRLSSLKPRLMRVVVRVDPQAAALDGLDVRFDGASVRAEAWGIRVPMDPGPHVVGASAPNHAEYKKEIVLDEPGREYEIEIPALTALPAPPKPPAEPPAAAANGSRSPLGYVLLGSGGLLLAGGAVSGALAFAAHRDSDDACPAGRDSCTTAGVRDEEAAHRFAWGANIGIGLGLVAAGIGTYLLLTSPPAARTRRAEAPLTLRF